MLEFKLDVDKREQKRLEKMLAEAPEKVRKKYVRRAVSFAVSPVLKAAKKYAPKDSGDLKKSLKRKIKAYSRNATVIGIVGPEKYKAPHAHLVEYGHRLVTKDGREIGFVPPHPFMRPAFTQNKETMLRRYRSKLIEGLNKEFKK